MLCQLNHYAVVPVGPPEWWKEAPAGRDRFGKGTGTVITGDKFESGAGGKSVSAAADDAVTAGLAVL